MLQATVSYSFDSVEDGRVKLDHGRKVCVFGGSGSNLKMSCVVLLNSNIVLVVAPFASWSTAC